MTDQPVDATVVDEPATDLVPHQPTQPVHGTLFNTNDPVEVVEHASRVANALKTVLANQGMIQKIGQGEHVRVEGWQTLGGMLGVVPVVVWTRRITDPDGWEAKVEARTLDGRVVGAGESQCDRGERRWKTADEHAIRSMAQTRATSKALAAPLRFIIKLAGFDGTPAEEMPAAGAAPSPAPSSSYGKDTPLAGSQKRQIYELASGKLTALELLNTVRDALGAKPLNLGENDALTRLEAGMVNLSREQADRVLQAVREKVAA